MREINHFKFLIVCKIIWYNVVMIYQLLDDVTLDN
jgi:hypothetical protein